MPTPTLHNEKELLKQTAEGSETAFTQLFYAYHNRLGAYIYYLTESRETAEDIVQAVFMKIWLNREKLAKVERFDAYIYVLSRNQTLNHLRQLARERMKKKEVTENLKKAYQTIDTEEGTPDYYVLMDEAVDNLPPQQKKAYILSRRKRLKYSEIAQQMGLSHETVKKYLKLATLSITNYVRSHSDLLLIIFLTSFILQ